MSYLLKHEPHHRSPVIASIVFDLRRLAALLIVTNLCLPFAVIVYAELTGENLWRQFYGEEYAMTWFSSVQLLLIGAIAYVNYEVAAVESRLVSGPRKYRHWIWVIFALGFVFLSLDDRFMIHENLRDAFTRDARIVSELKYIEPGDVILYLYFGIGLVFAWVLFGELKHFPPAIWYFVGALAITLSTIVIDALPRDVTREWPIPRYWRDVYEEVGEVWAQLLFLLSFLAVLRGRLLRLVPGAAESQHADSP